ncbi:hypothetical protein ACE6H2_027362 [Prunus campanulata]
MAYGHMIPVSDMAKLFAAQGVKTTIITTPLNAPTFSKSTRSRKTNSGRIEIEIKTIKFPSQEAGLPEGCENLDSLPTPEFANNFSKALGLLQEPLERLLLEDQPSCLVADMFFPWATDAAAKFGIPRLVFHGISFFALAASDCVRRYQPFKNVSSDSEPFVIPNLPGEIKMTRAQHTSATGITMLPLALVLFLLNCHIVSSASTIKTLPGFSGELPFELETGYLGVGDSEDVQLFYYFVESERNPKEDPLVLWLTGGPGCSSFSGLALKLFQLGNIIFLDQPVGTGFSYAKSSQGYMTGDALSAAQTYEFLRKWITGHPQFLKNPLYIGGDSYSGNTVPIITQEISNGKLLLWTKMFSDNGYILGNPFTDPTYDVNSRIKFAHNMALISDALYESTKTNCKGEYVQVDPSNAPCVENLQEVTQAYNYLFSFIWANDKTVQNALHVREVYESIYKESVQFDICDCKGKKRKLILPNYVSEEVNNGN